MLNRRFSTAMLLFWVLSSLCPPAHGAITLTPEGVMARTLEQNFGIRINKLEATRAQEALREFNAQFDTELFGNLDYSKDELERAIVLFGDSEASTYGLGARRKFISGTQVEAAWRKSQFETTSTFYDINPNNESIFSLRVRQPLLNNAFGLVERGEEKILKTNISGQRVESTNRIEDILSIVLDGYWLFVAADRRVEIRERALTESRALLAIQNRKRKFGIADDVDVYQTTVTVKLKEKDLLTAHNLRRDVQERLRIALGYPVGEELKSTAPPDLPEALFNEDKEIAGAFTSRRDLKQLDLDAKANAISIRIAKNSRWPQLDFVGTLSSNGVDSSQLDAIQDSFSSDGWFYMAGGELSIPLENRLARANVNRAVIDRTRIVFSIKDTQDKIIQQVGESVRETNLQLELARRNQEIRDLERKKYRAEVGKFRQGRSSSDLVTRFLDDALSAELEALQSIIDFNRARIRLLQVKDELLGQIDLDDEAGKVLR